MTDNTQSLWRSNLNVFLKSICRVAIALTFLLGDAFLDIFVVRGQDRQQCQRRGSDLDHHGVIDTLLQDLRRRKEIEKQFTQQLLVVDRAMV